MPIDPSKDISTRTRDLQSVRRTRSDAIATAIKAYLSNCKANGTTPELDECWRFTADRSGIEENHNGNLVYPIRGGMDVREITRKQFSARLKSLLKEH